MSMIQMSPPPISQNAMADLLCTIMVLCRGRGRDGSPCWAYLCIKPSMAKAFTDARKKGIFDISEYGSIIESGVGAEPPANVQRRMEVEYGMNHNYEDDLLRAAEAVKKKRDFEA